MKLRLFFTAVLACVALASLGYAQTPEPKQKIRTVTIPISIFTKKELKEKQVEEYVQVDRLIVKEDKDGQQILSIRSVETTPLSIAFLIQEDLTSTFNLQIPDIKQFIRDLPSGTRVMVAYARAGAVQVRQRFTDDHEKAANAIRIVSGNAGMAPRSPYDSVVDVLGKFDAVPSGRRAILLFSDGLDASEGTNLGALIQTFDLDQAVLKAQKKSVAVYSFYSPTPATDNGNGTLVLGAQGALNKLSDQTGGRAFFQGAIAPVSYLPYFKDLVVSLKRQFSLTYVSTHMNKGYHRVLVESTNPEVKIQHPQGYYYR